MEIEITNTVDNGLLGRKDVTFLVKHPQETTPSRVKARELVAGAVGAKTGNVVIASMHSATGLGATRGTARAYQNAEAARKLEREHLLRRNNLWQEKKEGDKGGDDAGEKEES